MEEEKKEYKIRTLEELKECEFEDLTYGELRAYDLDCEEYCDCYEDCKLMCSHCPEGGTPCEFWKPDTIMFTVFNSNEKYREEREREEDERERKSKERKQKLAEYKDRNFHDLFKIRSLKRRIKYLKQTLSDTSCLNNLFIATNIVNQIFQSCNGNSPADVDNTDIETQKQNTLKEIAEAEQQIIDIKASIKEKEKLFKKQNKEIKNE